VLTTGCNRLIKAGVADVFFPLSLQTKVTRTCTTKTATRKTGTRTQSTTTTQTTQTVSLTLHALKKMDPRIASNLPISFSFAQTETQSQTVTSETETQTPTPEPTQEVTTTEFIEPATTTVEEVPTEVSSDMI